MREITHLKIIFPLAFEFKHMLKAYWDEKEGCLVGAVYHHNVYWREGVLTPNYAEGMEVHVGVERKPEADIFGTLVPCPAQGILRGEYLRFDPHKVVGALSAGGWGWVVFRLRYDMQEGPENWDLHKSGYQVYSTGQAPNFYYAAEKLDDQ